MGWLELGILFGACALFGLVGWIGSSRALSLGYGLALTFGAVYLLFLSLFSGRYGDSFNYLLAQCALLILCGMRVLSAFVIRDASGSGRPPQKPSSPRRPFLAVLSLWLLSSIVCTAALSPLLFRFLNSGDPDIVSDLPSRPLFAFLGFAVSFLGFCAGIAADLQKRKESKERPGSFARQGVYRFVRFPNYFGEILFWIGIYLSGIRIYVSVFQWILSSLGFAGILLFMISSAHRLEHLQNLRHGQSEEYRTYVGKTPALLPLIPLFRLTKESLPVAGTETAPGNGTDATEEKKDL
ncbi:MAG: DUF1295 domain-containing protein [Clostridia bacterium]|nr:DUF1295 domain-containing protein [Clostridia bacterium]